MPQVIETLVVRRYLTGYETFTGKAIFQDTRTDLFYFRLRHRYRGDENPRKSFRDANISIFISIIRAESAPRHGSVINNDLRGITIKFILTCSRY